MELVFPIAELLVENPMIAALLEIGTLFGLWWVYRDGHRGRGRLHDRMDGHMLKFTEHEKECAERWGKVETKMDDLDRYLSAK